MSTSVDEGSFFDELKRRKVYQSAAAYGAAVFAFWQAADIALPALGLPPALLRFVVVAALMGFPVSVGLSWAFEVVPQSPRSDSSRPVRLLVLRPVLFAGIVVVLLGAAAWMLFPRTTLPVDEGAWVLIADLRNATGDSVFDATLAEALGLTLAQSSRVNVLPASRVRQGLQQMRRGEGDPLDEATALELATRQGVSAVVLPSLTRIGDRYVLEVRLVDPVTERTLTSRVQTASEADDILRAIDRTARELRRDLGETLASMVRTRIRLPQATTRSLQALKAWADAQRQGRAGHDDQAGIFLRRAVQLDSTFALAQVALGQWYYWNGNDPVRGDLAFDQALAHLDGVTERERLIVRGTVAEWRGDREAAATWFAALAELLPRDPMALSRLAYVYLRLGRDDEAIQAYERVLTLDSLDANAWTNLATLRYARGDLGAAVPLYEHAFRLQPDLRSNAVVNEEYGHALVLLGRFDDAETLYQVMLSGPPTSRARGLRSMALLRSFSGRYAESADLLRQAIVLHQAGAERVSELRDRTFLGAAHLRLGRQRDALDEIRASHRLAVGNRLPTILLGHAGALAARVGELGIASELLDSALARSNGSLGDRGAVEYLRGEIALGVGDPDQAVEYLEVAATLQASGVRPVRVLSALAKARLALGDREHALELFREVVQAVGSRTARESQEPWIMAHYRLARLQEELGQTDAARASYQRFLTFWAEGDAQLPEVADARRRLEELVPG